MEDGSVKAQRVLRRQTTGSFTISPNGERLAFIVEHYDAQSVHQGLYVLSLGDESKGTGNPRRLTRVANARSPKWGPDGERIAFLGKRPMDPVGPGDTNNEDQVWIFDLSTGGDAMQATAREKGVSEFDWGPDGNRLVIVSPDPDTRKAYEPEIDEAFVTERLHYEPYLGSTDDLTPFLYILHLESGEVERIDDAYSAGVKRHNVGAEPRWNPHSEQIAFISNQDKNPDQSYVMDVYIASAADGSLQRVTEGGLLASRLKWSPDGSKLAFVGEYPDDTYELNDLFVAEGDFDDYRCLSADFDRSIGTWYYRRDVIEWQTDDTLVGMVPDEGHTRFVQIHTENNKIERVLDNQGQFETVDDFELVENRLVAALEQPVSHDLYEMQVGSELSETSFDNFTPITNLSESLVTDSERPVRRKITFEANDGESVEMFAYFPPDADPDTCGPLPTFVDVHYGMRGFDEPGFSMGNLYWPSRGYVVLRINYRGSASYGYDFSAEIDAAWGTRDVADLREGVEFAVDQGWSDPDNLFLHGHSKGATIAAHLLVDTEMFSAATLDRGKYDFYGSYGTTFLKNRHENEFGLPWEDPAKQREVSVTPDIEKLNTPSLIIGAGHDTVCPSSQSEQLYARLKKRDVPARYVLYPKHGHFFPHPKLYIHLTKHTENWFSKFRTDSDQ